VENAMNFMAVLVAIPLALGQSGVVQPQGHDAGKNTLMYRQILAVVTDWREDGFYHRSDFEWPAISVQIFSTPDNVLDENALSMGAGVGINNLGARDLHLHLMPGIQYYTEEAVRVYGEGGLRYYPDVGPQFKGIVRFGGTTEAIVALETPNLLWTFGLGFYGEWRANERMPGSVLASADVVWRFAPRFGEVHFGVAGFRASANTETSPAFALRLGLEILN
jgi:hypothetical protein